jgi:phosphomannomutase/phosphoglucomutase
MTKLFGTNGIRGVVNETMNGHLALNIGQAWGSHLTEQMPHPRIAIGTDARLSNTMLKNAITAGLLATGCNVEDIGLVPTPTVQYAVKTREYTSAVVITASHNPPQFNGIKGIATDGTEFDKPTEEKIESRYFQNNYNLVSWNQVGQYTTWDGAIEAHLKGILKTVDVQLIKKKRFSVVLDCGNGAGCVIAPQLLEKLGCTIKKLNCQLDGRFPGRPSEPVQENVAELIEMTSDYEPVFGVALDGDADRAIFVDEKGSYLMGDISLSLLGNYFAQQNPGALFLTPITTSTVFEDAIKKEGGVVEYTRVGSPIVAREMIEKNAVFGGEENGGLIFPQLQYCRDALMTIAKMLDLLTTKNKTISELASTLPHYSMVKSKISCPNGKKAYILNTLSKNLHNDNNIKDIDRTDGVKLFINEGWVLLRPSGTEQIFRIYAEAKTIIQAQKLVIQYTKIVQDIIKNH